jgi:shikimate kinase
MNLKRPITLIGLMGSGKTTIGLHLAKKLDVPFVDSDKVIEEQAGYAISEIFQRDGEQFFRKVEAKTISEILGRNEICVLATGGGAFMNEETRKIIKEKSISVWLNASLNILIERLEHNNTRPLLANVDKKQMLQKLMDERYPIYAQADIIVDTDVNSRTIVGNEIMMKLETWQS